MTTETRPPLFRREVLEHRAERLHGDVSLAVPISWQVIGYLLMIGLVVGLIFLATASYARVATVTGVVVLDKGVAAIVPTRSGVVSALTVREGQTVAGGEPLVRIRSEEDMTQGDTAPRRVVAALADRDRRLANQTALLLSAADAERSRFADQIAGLAQEIASLDGQIGDQRRLVTVAEGEFRDATAIAAEGFISRRDLATREGTLIQRRQQLLQLQQARSSKSSDLAQARRLIVQSDATAQGQAAGVQSTRAELAQQVAQAEAAQGYTLTAPVAGKVTALTARVGQPAMPNQPLLTVMPLDGRPRVELYVPTSAAGFLSPGQTVRLAVDAFPYQRFGTITGRITTISSTAIPRGTADGGTIPVYLLTAEVSQPWMMAFGARQPLLPGMSLTARIVTQRQTLLEWLFEPLLAVGRR